MNKHLIIMLISGSILAGCAAPSIQTGPDAEVTFDGLNRVDNTFFESVWVRSDIDLSSYTGIMLEGAEVSYAATDPRASSGLSRTTQNETEFPLNAAQRARLEKTIADAFVSSLAGSKRYTLVTEPGSAVLLVKGSLLDVVSFIPIEANQAMSSILVRDIGEATLVIEIYDSNTNAILARGIDRRTAGDPTGLMNANRANITMEVTRQAYIWANRLRDGLDALGDGTAFAE